MPCISNTSVCTNNYKLKGVVFGYGGRVGQKLWGNIYSLNMHTLEYRRYSKLGTPKYGVTMTIDNKNNLFVMDGNCKSCHLLKSDVIQSELQTNCASNLCTEISEMHCCRIYGGSTYLLHDDNKIVVGGGSCNQWNDAEHDIASHSVEMYDANKNEWNLDNLLLVGTIPRDILLGTAVKDVDITFNLRELTKVHYQHLTKYHSKKEQQDRNMRCVYFQHYLNKFEPEHAEHGDEKSESEEDEMIRFHSNPYIFNARYFVESLVEIIKREWPSGRRWSARTTST
jgi:hypothetical protein